MSANVILELQQQRDELKSNIQDVDENIKKLTGRDPSENRRMPVNRRVQLKRNSFGHSESNQPPLKRVSTERRRWGTTALKSSNLDSGGEENEEKKPAVHSSVVATGKPIESLQKPNADDSATKNRNRRMFGLLVGTLKQFKKDSQVKTIQEAKREEILTKVEEQVQKEKAEALEERRELYQTRRNKQQELHKLEFKLEMAELTVEVKAHYEKFKDLIRLKSTPRVFYKPAVHNEKTKKLTKETNEMLEDSLNQRIKEIEICAEEDIKITSSRLFLRNRDVKGPGKSSKDPIVIDAALSKRDLFAEDADNDKREQDSNTNDQEKDDVSVEEIADTSDPNATHLGNSQETGEGDELNEDVDGEAPGIVVGEGSVGDERRVVSDPSYDVVDERVVEVTGSDTRNIDISDEKGLNEGKLSNDVDNEDEDFNIYDDMQQGIELFQPDDSESME